MTGQNHLSEICPDTAFDEVYVSGSTNCAAALLANSIDAAVIRSDQAQFVLNEAPEAFVIHANFTEEFPWLLGNGLHTNSQFEQTHAEAVQDIVRAVVEVAREINANPEILVLRAAELQEVDPDDLRPLVETYVASGILDENGGLTEASVNQSMDFFKAAGEILEDADVTTMVNLNYLDAVLADLAAE